MYNSPHSYDFVKSGHWVAPYSAGFNFTAGALSTCKARSISAINPDLQYSPPPLSHRALADQKLSPPSWTPLIPPTFLFACFPCGPSPLRPCKLAALLYFSLARSRSCSLAPLCALASLLPCSLAPLLLLLACSLFRALASPALCTPAHLAPAILHLLGSMNVFDDCYDCIMHMNRCPVAQQVQRRKYSCTRCEYYQHCMYRKYSEE